MAHSDLQDEITVIVNVTKYKFPNSVYPRLFNRIQNNVNNKLDRAKKQIAPNVGRELANLNQKSQKAGIISLNARCSGRLFNSITIKGGRGTQVVRYTVGTNMRKDYPHYVVYGRPMAVAHNKALKFKPKCNGDYIYRKWARASTAKNYLRVAESLFKPHISSIVHKEVQRVLGN